MNSKYEKFVKNTQNVEGVDYFFAGLVEEVGELLQLRRKELQGDMISKSRYRDELGDILWFLTALVDLAGKSTLNDVQRENMSKISQKRIALGLPKIGVTK